MAADLNHATMTIARLLRLMARSSKFKDGQHDVVLKAAATELERYAAEYPPNMRLAESLEECLGQMGWSHYSDDDLLAEAKAGNGAAPYIIRARAALASAKVST